MAETNGEGKRTLLQWVKFIIPYVYFWGLVVIVAWMIASLSIMGYKTLSKNPSALFLQESQQKSVNQTKTGSNIISKTPENQTKSEKDKQDKDSWLDTVVKPIVDSKFNQIIFRGLFLILVWVLLFLVIPVTSHRLKRFKLFNMEFEVENKEKVALQSAETNAAKIRLMEYLSSDDAKGKTLAFLRQDNSISFQEVLEDFLEEIKKGYSEQFDSHFTYQIHIDSFPQSIKEFVEESKEKSSWVIKNKPDSDNILKKNYLIFYYEFGGIVYVTEITSFSTQFEIVDGYLVQLLHNMVGNYIETIEYMVALSELSESEQ